MKAKSSKFERRRDLILAIRDVSEVELVEEFNEMEQKHINRSPILEPQTNHHRQGRALR
jgi:hypothetical protein